MAMARDEELKGSKRAKLVREERSLTKKDLTGTFARPAAREPPR
jgi:hypothetical protein